GGLTCWVALLPLVLLTATTVCAGPAVAQSAKVAAWSWPAGSATPVKLAIPNQWLGLVAPSVTARSNSVELATPLEFWTPWEGAWPPITRPLVGSVAGVVPVVAFVTTRSYAPPPTSVVPPEQPAVTVTPVWAVVLVSGLVTTLTPTDGRAASAATGA